MEYLQSVPIFILLLEKLNAEELISNNINILIRAAKLVNKWIIWVKTLKYWHKVKIYIILLVQYLGKKNIEIFCQEIKSFISIKLKMLLYW